MTTVQIQTVKNAIQRMSDAMPDYSPESIIKMVAVLMPDAWFNGDDAEKMSWIKKLYDEQIRAHPSNGIQHCRLDVLLMPNGEIMCAGHSLGFYESFKKFLTKSHGV